MRLAAALLALTPGAALAHTVGYAHLHQPGDAGTGAAIVLLFVAGVLATAILWRRAQK